jgi:hypothetical protein
MATLPAAFLAALGQPGAHALYWIEIEGLPYAYGNRVQTSALWASLPLAERFEGLRPYLPGIPGGVDARLDPLEGMASPGEFQFSVVDADGFLTQAANVGREDVDVDALYLTADANPGAGTLSVGGNVAAWPAAGTAYVGRTTVSYTGLQNNGDGTGALLGVTMGRYRSPDVLHTRGEPVTRYPVHLRTRRCWFYLALSTSGSFGISDRVTRYAGAIDDYHLESGAAALTTWVLVVRTPEKQLADVTLFRELRAGRLKSSLPAIATGASYVADPTTGTTAGTITYEKADEADPGVLTDAVTGELVLELERTDLNAVNGFADGEWTYLRVEDEILKGVWDGAKGRLRSIYRGLFGTSVAQHAYTTEWREGVPLVGRDATGIPEAAHSKFTKGDRPEDLVLQLLCNSGTYGVLPETWNAGFAASRIDLASFETIRDEVHAGEHLVAWVDEPVSFSELVVEQLLKPWGLFLVHGSDDLVRLGYLRQGPPAATAATIDSTTIVGPPTWKSGAGATIGEYRLECDVDVLEGVSGSPGTILADLFIDTRRLYGKEKVTTVVHRSIFAHLDGGIADAIGSYRKAFRTFDSRRAFFASQYGRPSPVISVRALFSLFPVQPGEWVTVNLPAIPSMVGAARGYSGPGFVQAKKPVDREWVVELEILLLGAALDRYAFVAPAGKVVSKAGASVTLDEVRGFDGGDVCVFVSPKLDQVTAAVVITSGYGNAVSLTSVPAPVAAGWFLVWADWDSLTPSQKARKGAAFADAAETLGSLNDRAYRYSGS